MNLEAVVRRSRQTRRVTDGTIDIGGFSAEAANDMVMVISHPILVKRRRPGGLDAPNQTLFDQYPEGVVNGLSRDDTNPGANLFRNVVRGAVGLG
jgi:hypothetical protein